MDFPKAHAAMVRLLWQQTVSGASEYAERNAETP